VDAAELGESYATNGRYNMVNPIINDGKLGASYAMMVNPIIKHPRSHHHCYGWDSNHPR
jgi:hypothetical protein